MNGAGKADYISIKNAAENNLKNITTQIPLNHFVCVTGPSGCGKSSLIYDTIYAESQRNFLESLSGNMFGQKLMDKPKVESIENLRPALNIAQNYYNVNPRSTVGTITDISYYIRTLYAFVTNQDSGTQWDMNHFSPNNPLSCCPNCRGIGEEYVVSEQLLIPDKRKPLSSGGIVYYKGSKTSQEYKLLEAICDYYSIDINKKVCDLTDQELMNLVYRKEPQTFAIKFKTPKGKTKQWNISAKGALVELEEKLTDIDTPSTYANIAKYLVKQRCRICNGQKYNESIRSITVCGLSIGEVEQLSLNDLQRWCEDVKTKYRLHLGANQVLQIINEIEKRVQHLIDLSLEYIAIGRSVPTLSSGELQRVRLASQLDCSLSGMLYILDEPCKGLHYKNIDSILNSVRSLIKKGNTVIAIDHNPRFIASSDYIIEMGPVGGPQGGYILNEGTSKKNYNAGIKFKHPRKPGPFMRFQGISCRNLKSLNANIPSGNVVCISGVSGSGKSTLASIIEECCLRGRSEFCNSFTVDQLPQKVMRVNQQPIGKTARSTVVSYLGIYDEIRDLFAATDAARESKLHASDFSVNVSGGRCECCLGTGKQKIELSYLPESYITCPECKGQRFHRDVLSVTYNGYSINDVLNENIDSLLNMFENNRKVYDILKCMSDLGLGYLSLGQMSMNLSGGEAQRIKLAKYLGLGTKGTNLYILDEPTTGLSRDDIKRLEKVIDTLADHGNTIIIIEHNIEFIAEIADYLIDLGNLAGNSGGHTLLEGNPETVVNINESSWSGII